MNTSILNLLKEAFLQPRRFLHRILNRCAPLVRNDKLFLEWEWYLEFGRKLDLTNPKTFNEKLQWLKLYDRKPVYTRMVDKYEAKKYVADIVGDEYIIPTLGVWDNARDIDFDSLPEQFVLKCTHDSGGIIICKDNSSVEIIKIKEKLARSLESEYFWFNREWPYKDVSKRIIAEQFLGDNLQDYRVYCFNGKPKLVYSYTNRSFQDGSKPEPAFCDIMDCEWNPLPFHQKSPARGGVPKPSNLDLMLKLAVQLSENSPFLRVDFYEIGEQLYIGELTFFPGSGFAPFYPPEWDLKLGEYLTLPE